MNRVRVLSLLILALVATPADMAAQTPPPPSDARAVHDRLFEALRTAPTEQAARAVEDRIWRFWMRSAPDPESADLMNKAMERREQYDFAGAIEHLDKLVARAPDWSEAWNQRATVLFFQEEFDRSLEDVEKVLALEPRHFGALAGKAVMLMQQGRIELGQKALREAVAVHPWLRERRMLLQSPGQSL